jgi:hypothetical protein
MRPVPQVSDVDVVFPARGPELTPPYDEIPDEFKRNAPEVRLFYGIFSGKPPKLGLKPREGVDGAMALKVLQVVMGTYGTKHEHKVAGWAFLCREWFELTPQKGESSDERPDESGVGG